MLTFRDYVESFAIAVAVTFCCMIASVAIVAGCAAGVFWIVGLLS